MTILRNVKLALFGASTARGALAGLRSRPPGGSQLTERTNYRGETVTCLAGPALATAASVAAAAGAPNKKLASAALVAGAGAGIFGLYDDIVGNRAEEKAYKGFRGHLRALREKRLSAGLVKLAGVSTAGLIAARAVTRRPADLLVTGGIIAGTANLVNLLDLRPGRALKASLIAGTPLLAGSNGGLIAGPLGASTAILPEDLGERVMIGDAGANALGAILGLRLATAGGSKWRVGVLATLIALTAASEKVSFTKVIEKTPMLRQVDEWGRR